MMMMMMDDDDKKKKKNIFVPRMAMYTSPSAPPKSVSMSQ